MSYLQNISHVPIGKYWRALDLKGGSNMGTGREDLLLLRSLVMANRPQVVVETGTYRAYGTIAISEALLDERSDDGGFIREKYLMTIEFKKNLSIAAQRNHQKFLDHSYPEFIPDDPTREDGMNPFGHIPNPVDIQFVIGTSTASNENSHYAHWAPIQKGLLIDFAFIDCGDRLGAFQAMYPYLRDNALVCVHDAHDREREYSLWMEHLKAVGMIKDFCIIPTERGMALLRVKKSD